VVRKLALGLALSGLFVVQANAFAADAELRCELHFVLSGWSVFYKTASGSGIVSCDDGQKMRVQIEARGGGLTFGKSEVDSGLGNFSHLNDIRDVLGTYASADVHAGAMDSSSEAQAMTKGPVSLAVSGKGRGWDLGVAFGKFTISRSEANSSGD
jgi:hypothetical protein